MIIDNTSLFRASAKKIQMRSKKKKEFELSVGPENSTEGSF